MLQNLPEIVREADLAVATHVIHERKIPDAFMEQYSTVLQAGNASNINWNDHSLSFNTNSGLLIVCPSQWFYLATLASPFMSALMEYKNHARAIFEARELTILAKEAKETGELTAEVRGKISAHFEDDADSERFCTWLTDYDQWKGGKTVDRGDFFYTPINSTLKIVQVFQGYLSEIVNHFYHTPELPALLQAKLNEEHIVWDAVEFNEEYAAGGGQNLIIYGAPGTGKSYAANGNHARCIRTVFHADYSYQDFVGSYRPCKVKGQITYEFTPGPFIKSIINAHNNPDHMHTLIIEEINRANAGAVFGEVFQLLDRKDNGESEYSVTPDEALAIFLKANTEHMGEKLWLPANLNIHATMNSADQGVFPLDSAFKRRWKFKYLPISFDNVAHKDALLPYANKKITWEKFATAINTQLSLQHINEDRQLGPYFLKANEIEDAQTVASKVLIYLWDDVVRHQRPVLFSDQYRTFSSLMTGYVAGKDIFSEWDEPVSSHLTD